MNLGNERLTVLINLNYQNLCLSFICFKITFLFIHYERFFGKDPIGYT